jgi:cytochrome P450
MAHADASGMEAILRDPDQVALLPRMVEDEDLRHNAAEELMRWTAPVRHALTGGARCPGQPRGAAQSAATWAGPR